MLSGGFVPLHRSNPVKVNAWQRQQSLLTGVPLIATLCRLMLHELPQTIIPEVLARQGVVIEGDFAVASMPRLCEMLQDRSGQASFRLEFGRDAAMKQVYIRGSITTMLHTPCQRCLTRMDLNLSRNIFLGVVRDQEEAQRLPEGCEPLIMPDTRPVTLLDFIEDELILAMPITAMHDTEQCPATRLLQEINTAARNKPFRALREIRNKIHNS